MKHIDDVNEKNEAARIMLYILAIGTSPLFVMLFIYMNNPASPLLNLIYVNTSEFPALVSTNNVLLSTVFSAYCKTAPIFGFLFLFISLSFNKLKINKRKSNGEMVRVFVAFSLLYIFLFYFLLLHNNNLSESGHLLRFLSRNDYLLLLLFISIFMSCYIFTCCFLCFIYYFFLAFKVKK